MDLISIHNREKKYYYRKKILNKIYGALLGFKYGRQIVDRSSDCEAL